MSIGIRDGYSRLITLLKVVFPLAALALLSTLFLISRGVETDAVIPFADKEIQDRLRDQQVTGPFFTSTTTTGDQMSFTADTLVTLPGRVGANRAKNVVGTLESEDGATFQLVADEAELDMGRDTADLVGDVSIVSSSGYRINTPSMTALISDLDLYAPAQVDGIGPIGTLRAGNMRVFSPNEGKTTQMVFSGGVKLVYTPK